MIKIFYSFLLYTVRITYHAHLILFGLFVLILLREINASYEGQLCYSAVLFDFNEDNYVACLYLLITKKCYDPSQAVHSHLTRHHNPCIPDHKFASNNSLQYCASSNTLSLR
jgi:hypothetical protein